MKKILPSLAKILIIILFLSAVLFYVPRSVFAQAPIPGADVTNSNWQPDSEVSFVGKTGVRSGDFLDWTLQNYSWLCVKKTNQNLCDNTNNPLISFWVLIRNIVYAFIALFVLSTAFILIITRGQNITIMRFVPRFIFIIILITFSFSLVQFIYQIVDIIQGFFLNIGKSGPSPFISTQDLLYIGFDYKNFIGYRLIGPTYDESAFISLLLVRLTAITYYVMTGILLVRKIILWFFIIISPIFPLLLFYKPLRNTAKIWIGEFFRWLLYAPLFAIFLHGLVVVWQKGIPLKFDFTGAVAGEVVYPTAINILLGGPGQTLSITNSVNLRDTFALYVVALLMLWVVILLPFLLLKIFLDYLATISFENNVWFKQISTHNFPFLGPQGTPSAPTQPPGKFQPAGIARVLPFMNRGATVPVQFQASIQASVKESANILQLANLSIPRMRDVAAYETSMMSRDATRRAQASNVAFTLQKIANPTSVTTSMEREKFTNVRQKLLEQKQKGNPIASSVLAASQVTSATTHAVAGVQVRTQQLEHVGQMLRMVANPELATTPATREKAAKLKQTLLEKKSKGDNLASSILDTQDRLAKGISVDQKEQMEGKLLDALLDAEKTGDSMAEALLSQAPAGATAPRESLPVVNRVQQVSLEDYEEVRKLWTENYETLEPPKGLNGEQEERRVWIKNDIDKINQAISLLSAVDPEKVKEGMSMVSTILPFLLIGGFSKSEVIAYLKAKMEAGKQVLTGDQKREEEEESKISARAGRSEKPKEAEASAKLEEPIDENPTFQKPGSKITEGDRDKLK